MCVSKCRYTYSEAQTLDKFMCMYGSYCILCSRFAVVLFKIYPLSLSGSTMVKLMGPADPLRPWDIYIYMYVYVYVYIYTYIHVTQWLDNGEINGTCRFLST